MEHLKKVKALLSTQQDLGKDPDTFAYHGTNLAAIRHLAEHGTLPTQGADATDFYYTSIDNPHLSVPKTRTPLADAASFAKGHALALYTIDQLRQNGIKIDEETREQLILLPDTGPELPDDPDLVKKLRKTISSFVQSGWKGVVLGLNNSLAQDFEQQDSGMDWYVTLPNGLDIQHITSITPMGPSESKILWQGDLSSFEAKWF